jgi:hypothetical protein
VQHLLRNQSQSSYPWTLGRLPRLTQARQAHFQVELPELVDTLVKQRVVPYHDRQAAVPGLKSILGLLGQPARRFGAGGEGLWGGRAGTQGQTSGLGLVVAELLRLETVVRFCSALSHLLLVVNLGALDAELTLAFC